MWTKSYSKTVKDVSSQTIWKVWTDVNSWPLWHEDLEYCQMRGNFAVGNHFMLKPKGMRAVKIELTEIEEGHKFTDCTPFPGAKMYVTHEMQEIPEGLRLTNTLRVAGPLGWLWVKLVVQKVADGMPEEMDSLIQVAKGFHAKK